MTRLSFATDDGPRDIAVTRLIVAGWTARDAAAVAHHIAELAALGVPAPSAVPLYYRLGAGLLTQETTIEVLGPDSSGEVEPLILDDGTGLWLGLASDHTDRKLEAVSVAFSKQACPKPVGTGLWRLDSVADRLDSLELCSFIRDTDGEDWLPYQQGSLAAIRPLAGLIAGAPGASAGRLGAGTAMLCGTLGAIGGVRPARQFRMELHDPATGRRLSHGYTVETLPVVA